MVEVGPRARVAQRPVGKRAVVIFDHRRQSDPRARRYAGHSHLEFERFRAYACRDYRHRAVDWRSSFAVPGETIGRPFAGRRKIELHVPGGFRDRKSTRLNSSHVEISYAVFCLKKKKKNITKLTHKLYTMSISTYNEVTI